MLSIKQTAQFKKDLKAAIKQGCDLDLLAHIIDTRDMSHCRLITATTHCLAGIAIIANVTSPQTGC